LNALSHIFLSLFVRYFIVLYVYTEEAMKLKKPVILIIKITGFLLINITTVQPQLDRFLANPVSPLHYQIHAAA
jgi:hypothetical protein